MTEEEFMLARVGARSDAAIAWFNKDHSQESMDEMVACQRELKFCIKALETGEKLKQAIASMKKHAAGLDGLIETVKANYGVTAKKLRKEKLK